jgi:hypothetical protein
MDDEANESRVPEYQFVRALELGEPADELTRLASVSWEADVVDMRARMGDSSNALLEGGRCEAHGRIPGTIAVYLPLRFGIGDEELSQLSVRLLTRQGKLLGRSPVRLAVSENDLPSAVSRVVVREVESQTVALVAQEGVVVDVAVDGSPDLDEQAVALLTRTQGLRAGQRAVAGAAAGRRDDAVQEWGRASQLHQLAGEPGLAKEAAAFATRTSSASLDPDWVAEVLEAYAHLARKVLGGGAGADPGELSVLVRELSAVVDATPELAVGHTHLARLLRNAGGDRDELQCTSHLYEAIRILRVVGDRTSVDEARTLLREI